MTGLPHRPDLTQLRRQAKELHRAAVAGEREGVRRLAEVVHDEIEFAHALFGDQS